MLLLGGQHCHLRFVDPGALTVPEATHDPPLNHILPQRPLRPVIGGLGADDDVVDAEDLVDLPDI